MAIRRNMRISVACRLLMHGDDAAFAGQGRGSRNALGCPNLKGYRTGGSLHFIVNNQIGFHHLSALFAFLAPIRPTWAKMIDAPIFHVNGDDPGSGGVFAAKGSRSSSARNSTSRSSSTCFCYRRHGHNEGDEPMFTQAGDVQEELHRIPARWRFIPSG